MTHKEIIIFRDKVKKLWILILSLVSLCLIALSLLVYSGSIGNNIFDQYGRLIAAPNKTSVTCPEQANSTAVLLAIGQSNSANYADNKFITKYPDKVVNYFNGNCYVASSPLLGSSGVRGEFLTPLADLLIDSGQYSSVVIVTSGIGNTAISRWRENSDLGLMLNDVLKDASKRYRITSVIWHQGERDYLDRTSASEYHSSFSSLRNILNGNKVDVPIFIAVSTRCGNPFVWDVENPIAHAQAALINNRHIFLGVDSDRLLNNDDRALLNPCHFNKEGQIKVAKSYANAILAVRNISK